MMKPLRLVPLVALVASAPAFAASAAEAEHIRISEQMRKLATRNVWRGVESNYQKLLDLEKKGVTLTVDDHLLGVQAAQALGSVQDAYDRLQAADSVAPSDDLKSQIAAIDASYGRVDLDVDDRFDGDFTLKPATMPFDPGQRKAVEVAAARIQAERKFLGMLPYGRYTLGERAFEVTKGGAVVEVFIGKKKAGGGSVATNRQRTGPRLDLGVQLGSMGAAEVTTEGGSAVALASDGAFGGRAGLGYELHLAKGWSLLLEGGWQGGFAGTLEASDDAAAGVREEASLGYQSFFGQVGATWYRNDLAVSVGPTYSYVMIDSAAEDPTQGALIGRATAGGGAVSVFYGLFDTPGLNNSRSGLSLAAGVFATRSMSFPWAQAAFTIAPEG